MGVCSSRIEKPRDILSESDCKLECKALPIFIPELVNCVCIKVYDGDTIRVRGAMEQDAKRRCYNFNIRISGIDTAELRSKCEYEKRFARYTRDYLKAEILGRSVLVDVLRRDKYGRLLAIVRRSRDGFNVAIDLQKKGLAVTYDGGKKIERDYESLVLLHCPKVL